MNMHKLFQRLAFLGTVLAAVIALPSLAPALTLDDLPVSTSAFKDPKQISPDISVDKNVVKGSQYLVAMTDDSNLNRFELLAHELPDVAYAEALLEAFNDQLVKTGFSVVTNGKEETFHLNDGSDLKGRHAEYSYVGTNADTTIHIELFAFVNKSMACILVGYYGADGLEDGRKSFSKIVQTFVNK